ncbi:MAG: FUSC family protein [Microbacteriaceae bacterium]
MAELAQSQRLKRLERSIRLRLDVRVAVRRAWASAPAALQIVVAATAAYAIARYGLGHALPVVAVTVTISTLGFTRDARPRRVLESVIGILVGILLAEILVLVVGQGIWQTAIVLFATLMVARLVSPSNAFAVAAGVQAMLVMVLPTPDGGGFIRSLDGLIGGVLALVVTALIPRDPRRIARTDTRRLVSMEIEALASLVRALDRADEPAARLGLNQLRRTQPVVDQATQSLDTALAVARISPFLRRHLPALGRQSTALTGFDLAARHLRLIARRIASLVRDGIARPVLSGLFARIAAGFTIVAASIDDPRLVAEGRAQLSELARELDPNVALPGAAVTDSIIIHLMRPLVVDLLVASGMPIDEARMLLPPV